MFAFVPGGGATPETDPPYEWKFIGVKDTGTNQAITAEHLKDTMRSRLPCFSREPDRASARCQLHLDGHGLTLNGRPTRIKLAVEACRLAGAAEFTVTGDALFGVREEVRAALERAGIEVYVRAAREE